eukprot:CAMPEP_0115431948 /NCGR_PEP_ID=MMETSP0271-20121206/31839_1 /TAXON_ID=71861 /ORGANISM="Scrippsiella trochoidea, Strain CCMP3099" /LENGTH=55 /DNA_ID=CAMNT_0002857255 /DNA_START=626 /DNA_END=791 /DNA_ORIENTATION=-
MPPRGKQTCATDGVAAMPSEPPLTAQALPAVASAASAAIAAAGAAAAAVAAAAAA